MNKFLLPKFLIVLFLLGIYSESVFAQSPTPDIGDTIREKVQEKVIEVQQKPRAYVGTVTDLATDAIQLKKFVASVANGDTAEIQQISTTTNTDFVNVGKTTKTIEFSDIAIGDFLVAMGYPNANQVLSAKRILLIEPITPSLRKSFIMDISDISKAQIKGNDRKGNEYTLQVIKSTKISTIIDGEEETITINNLNQFDKIICSTDTNDQTLEARKITVITPAPTSEE